MGKTKEVKIIQGYCGGRWEDMSEYDCSEYGQIKSDLAEYRASSATWPIPYRVITRRVPLPQK